MNSLWNRLMKLETANGEEGEPCPLCHRFRLFWLREKDPVPPTGCKCRHREDGPIKTIIFRLPDETPEEEVASMNAEEEARRWKPTP
jgi:hypothetical protein